MTNNIGGINGYGNYGVGGYVPQRKGNDAEEAAKQQEPVVQNHEETQIDPSKVMEFLNANNYFVAPTKAGAAAEVDAATEERIAGYMEQFEMIYGLVVEEFGEELAPAVMDLVMDKLMGLAA